VARTPKVRHENPVIRVAQAIFDFLCSVKLAVLLIVTLTVALIIATVLESVYDTATAQYWVYRALWFHGVLFAFGVLIFCVAVSRWPWQKKHTAFLVAHLGILTLLFGSWLTDRFGLDGSMRVEEGQTSGRVELGDRSNSTRGTRARRPPQRCWGETASRRRLSQEAWRSTTPTRPSSSPATGTRRSRCPGAIRTP
jgi:hypothetical protein